MAQPASVLIKIGFLVVLYLFLLWVARSALRDLRESRAPWTPAPDATGMYPAAAGLGAPVADGQHGRWLRVERGLGLRPGELIDVGDGALLGRDGAAQIRLEDPYASTRHARIVREGAILIVEDLGSTNGTFLNDAPLQGPTPLHPGDRLRIGETELTYES